MNRTALVTEVTKAIKAKIAHKGEVTKKEIIDSAAQTFKELDKDAQVENLAELSKSYSRRDLAGGDDEVIALAQGILKSIGAEATEASAVRVLVETQKNEKFAISLLSRQEV